MKVRLETTSSQNIPKLNSNKSAIALSVGECDRFRQFRQKYFITIMKIKRLHAHFLISTGNYNNERIGFSVEVNEKETLESVVSQLRERAKKIIGPTAEDFYETARKYARECRSLEEKLDKLRKEWDATANFLKAQGLNPEAPSMPQFRNLLEAVTVQSEVITEKDDNKDDDDDEDEDDVDFLSA